MIHLSPSRIRSLERVATAAAIVSVVSGCSHDIPLPPERPEPLLHLLVRTVDALDTASDSGLFASLLTIGSVETARYRTAERFDMIRVADGRRFAWRWTGVSGLLPQSFALLRTDEGNFFLPRSGGTELGWQDIRAGDEYELRIETEGELVLGRIRLPDAIPTIEAIALSDTTVRLSWARAPRSGGYLIAELDQGVVNLPERHEVHADTMTVLTPRTFSRFADSVVVLAIDSSLSHYVRDQTEASAGLTGAFGLFGGFSRAVSPLPGKPDA